MIMTDGGPNGATQVMVERIYKYGFRYYRMGLCGGLLLDPVRHHYGVHRHPDEGPREVGQL